MRDREPSSGELLSIIVPTLNEEATIPRLIGSLHDQEEIRLEVIVADGGSTDDTVALAGRMGARVVRAPRGRGAQMNAGSLEARGAYLLFLHADSGIEDSLLLMRAVSFLRDEESRVGHGRVAGHFPIRFADRSGGCACAYGYMEEKSLLNRPQTTNGDQGCLLGRGFFESLGGFEETLPFLEDQRLAARIREEGRWITLPGVILTSARRFETEGFARRHILMAISMGLFSTGYAEFFLRADDVYRAQHQTGRLCLTPFFRLIRDIQKKKSLRNRVIAWYRVGRYVRQNAWQIFFMTDVFLRRTLGVSRNGFLRFYDRYIDRLLDFPVFDLITAGLTYLWVMGVLQVWFRLREAEPALHTD